MKVLQVISSFPPAYSYGGAARVAYEVSKELVKRGHEVTVYTTDVYDENSRLKYDENPIIMDGIKVYHFKNLSNSLAKNNFPIALEMFTFLKKNIQNFDLVHIQEYRSFQTIFAQHFAKKYDVPYILQPHGSTPRILEKKLLKFFFDFSFGYNIFKNAAKVVAVSEEEAEFDTKMGAKEKDISVVYNGLDNKFFTLSPVVGIFKRKHDINGKMILYLGRIHKTKGIDFAIKAFSELSTEMDDLSFVIAGSDSGFKKELDKLINELNLSKKVRFTGFIDEEEKIHAYSDADLFVHTVQYMGGVGLAPIEAVLCNTPVIVTKECGELIKKANSGYIVDYNDVTSLKDTMKYVLENPEEVHITINRTQEFIMKNFTWEKVAEQVLEIYYKVV
jgi:glycosyltransferase involved in cell wall biosynthesis